MTSITRYTFTHTRWSMMLGKLNTAIRILRKDGILDLIISSLMFLSSNFENRAISSFFSLLAYQLIAISHEKAVAYPSNGNVNLISIPEFQSRRKLPQLTVIGGTFHGSPRHVQMMKELYTYEKFVEIREGDLVVDVGSYVGGFAKFASERAEKVVAVEPNETIDNSLHTNVSHINNISISTKAGWNEYDKINMNVSNEYNENSLLEPDSGKTGRSYEVTADTISNIVRDFDFDHIDYLKIEAEGVEPEILEGALSDGMQINRIAVDASPERNKQDAIEEVSNILERYGYEVRRRDTEELWKEYIIFGKLNNQTTN
jgi:FkbM family methyltransferase